MKQRPSPIAWLLVMAVRAYQELISPGLPRRCKYYPSCSQYAIDALKAYGVARGLILAGWRLLRCNPWSYGGYDPVEQQKIFRPGHRLQDDRRTELDCQAGTHRPPQCDLLLEPGSWLRRSAWGKQDCRPLRPATGRNDAVPVTEGH